MRKEAIKKVACMIPGDHHCDLCSELLKGRAQWAYEDSKQTIAICNDCAAKHYTVLVLLSDE